MNEDKLKPPTVKKGKDGSIILEFPHNKEAFGKIQETNDPSENPALKNVPIECSDFKSAFTEKWKGGIYCNGFFDALHHSFNSHCGFEFVPDHVWLLICQGLSSFEAETGVLGKVFGLSEEKKEIKVWNNLILGSPNNDWTIAFDQFEQGIKENIPEELYALLSKKKFSTSTKLSQACFNVCLMDSLKKYLSYRNFFLCDIPLIKLSGTKEDWEKVLDYTIALSKVEGLMLDWWFQTLIPILQKFIDVYDNKVDTLFWRSPYRWCTGSGGSRINGWALAFFPVLKGRIVDWKEHKGFEEELKQKFSGYASFGEPLPGSVPNGINNVPFIWEVNGVDHPYNFYAGFLGMELVEENEEEEKGMRRFAKPRLGWAVGKRTSRNG